MPMMKINIPHDLSKALDIKTLTKNTAETRDVPEVTQGYVELYTKGFCHVFALANVLKWGGAFVIVENPEEIMALDEDGEDVFSIWHVMSLHDTPTGPVARDILGDRPLDEVKTHCQNLFACEDFEITTHTTPDVLELLSHTELAEILFDKNPDTCPLCSFETLDLIEAMAVGPSLLEPGQADAQPVPECED